MNFGEAKNAALLALSSAWIIGCFNLEFGNKATSTWALFLSCCCVLFSRPWSHCSLFPRLHLPHFLGGKRAGPHAPNLLYFGDISKHLALKELADSLRGRYLSEDGKPTEDYINDLVVQIGVNSQIAVRKMRCFRIGVALILTAGILLLILVAGIALQGMKTLW